PALDLLHRRLAERDGVEEQDLSAAKPRDAHPPLERSMGEIRFGRPEVLLELLDRPVREDRPGPRHAAELTSPRERVGWSSGSAAASPGPARWRGGPRRLPRRWPE